MCPNYDINAFVAYDDKYYFNGIASIIVAFAGTNPLSITDWIDDLDTIKIGYPLSPVNECNDCNVHKGFYSTYAAIRRNLMEY